MREKNPDTQEKMQQDRLKHFLKVKGGLPSEKIHQILSVRRRYRKSRKKKYENSELMNA